MRSYAANCEDIAAELASELTPDDVERLREQLRGMPIGAWRMLRWEMRDLARQLGAATPSHRTRQRAWASEEARLAGYLAAICWLRDAARYQSDHHEEWPFDADDPFDYADA